MKLPRPDLPVLLGLALLLLGWPLPASAQPARLANLSTRSQVGSGGNVLTVGFTITGTAKKSVLIRGVGPGLANVGFTTGTVADPKLTLFSGSTPIASNDDWGTATGTTEVTAATFTSVGAFALPAGSKDAVILTSLDPGGYTAQMSSGTGTTGLGIVEIYEMDSATGKLYNLSTTGPISTGGIMIAGLVITPGSGSRKLLVRAAGPALDTLGVPGPTLADPAIVVTDAATGKIAYASNNNWGTPEGDDALDATSLATIATYGGAFAFPAGSKDAVAYVELAPGAYTVQVTGAGAGGLATVEVYDLTPATSSTVTVAASKVAADESGGNNGEFTLTRTGDIAAPLTVTYGVGGDAVNAYDYVLLPGTVTIPAGQTTAKLAVLPYPDLQTDGTESVVVTLTANPAYTVGAQSSATVTIADSEATLYVASVRPSAAALASTASGTATILLSKSGTLAGVNVTFSNLSSAEVTAHLVIGSTEDYVLNLPQGQVSGVQWTFAPAGPYSSDALLAALKSGNISVRIDSANYPAGELKGSFIQGAGSKVFTPPAAPPVVALTHVTATDAARFLTQATFGPTKAEIDALTGGSIDTWLTTQLALPFTSHRTAVQDDKANYGGSGSFTNWNATYAPNRQSAWFKTALTAPDQLRQRVALALSELFVVSDVSLGDDSEAEPLAAYYDILGNGAFGNFRTLLENVTLNPMMGLYLSSLRNSKADPKTGQTPDENYAREVMQLFTIGLNQLQPDGTLVLDPTTGLPVATYTQTTITEMAKVFTGWGYPSTNANAFRSAARNYYSPMQNFASNHDTTAKNLSPVLATSLPAGQTGAQDLAAALDALFNHANTPPFVAKSLIQRLVTSNPSPAYVYRVAQKFVDNGSGVRGDLGAVVRAILTDYEARSPAVAAGQSFGKLKEPLLRLTGLMRSVGASSTSGRFLGYQNTVDSVPITGTTPKPATADQINKSPTTFSVTRLDGVQSSLAEAALRSPTVFNFYHPDYVLPGALASAGLVVPEFEITDDNYAIRVPNSFRTFTLANVPTTPAGPYTLALDLTYEAGLASTPSALLDHLNLVLCAGNMPAATKTRIITALAALPASTDARTRAQSAVLLTLTSPAAAIQK
jgi:uncharacterized protein (DUF1800 family)